jgi:hypothetical protein
MKYLAAFCLCLTAFFSPTASAQWMGWDVGVEFQAYPTGLIPGVRGDLYWGEHSGANVRLGYNWIRHGDAGVHEDERGGGVGVSAGYRRFLRTDFSGFFFGGRSDFWYNRLDWKDNIGKPNELTGESKVFVLQPTIEAGYLFLFADDKWFFTPAASFGIEINVATKGEETGQGLILLGGVAVGRRF